MQMNALETTSPSPTRGLQNRSKQGMSGSQVKDPIPTILHLEAKTGILKVEATLAYTMKLA